jgi:hypothetical protein
VLERARRAVRSAAGRLRELLQERGACRIAADLDRVDADLALVSLRERLRRIERTLLGTSRPTTSVGLPSLTTVIAA